VSAAPASLAYSACGILMLIYAWGRFNTPPSNRSSTRQALYWWSATGYVLCALLLFASLCILLEAGPWRTALLGPTDQPSLPAPLIATLAMTTLLPSVPLLKRVDEWLLSVFLDWAEIPAEVKRRAAAMTPRSFSITEADVSELRETYGEEGDGYAWARHLRGKRGEGFELSQYRFTRVVKLYDQIRKLAGEPRYARFFSEAENEFSELEQRTAEFLRRSAASLTLAEQLRALNTGGAFDEVMRERREEFAQRCREIFIALAQFLAHAALRSETTESGIVDRLRQTGFAAAEPMNLPRFPIDSLTILAVALFLYLILAGWVFAYVAKITQEPIHGVLMASKITLVRVLTIGTTIWLMQRFPFFRRAPGDPPRFFAYLVNGVIAAAVAYAISQPFEQIHAGSPLAPTLLSFTLCATVAFCCDDWIEDATPPAWLRFAEATGCALIMAVSMTLLYFSRLLSFPPESQQPLLLPLLISLPSGLAFVIGGYVPHLYRCARRAAIARHREVDQLLPPVASAQLQPSTPIRLNGRHRDGVRAGHAEHDKRGQQAGKATRHKGQQVIPREAARRAGAKGGNSIANLMSGKDPGNDDRSVAAPEESVVSAKVAGPAATQSSR